MQHNPYSYNSYNPYMYNANPNPTYPNIATAPPLDYVEQLHPVYPYPNGPYMIPVSPTQQYNQEIETYRKQEKDECCCLGLLIICCCCLN